MREERFSEIKDKSVEITHFDERTDFKREWKKGTVPQGPVQRYQNV